nr:PREDICTED: inactive protein RESTRICTED TEV MOVEMENT 2-like [Nicotiana tabacum]
MAMRPRGGGVRPNRPNRPPRAAVRPVYEDFRPIFERHQEEEAEKLLIYLPGFLKENIRVSTEGKNTVRVRGERLVAGNKWNRFQEDFQAPDYCNMRGIHAKFENGILTITMPWKMPKQLSDELTKQTPPITPPPPQKDTTDFPPKTVETPRKPTPLKPTAPLPMPQNVVKDQDSARVKERQRDEKKILEGQLGISAESSKTHKDTTDFPPKTTYPTIEIPRKPTPLKPTAQLPKPQHVDKDQDSRGIQGKQGDETKILEGLVGSIEPKIQKSKEEDKSDQNRTQLVKRGKEVEKKESHEAGGKKVAEKSKELIEKFQEKVEHKESKDRQITGNLAAGASSHPGGEFSIGNLKKSIAELNEERQLLVNAGAAVLVIMALGAYLYHSIGSGRAE